MRNRNLILALAGAVIFGLIGVVLVTRYLSSAQAYTKSLGNVVIAKAPITLGSKITAEQLATAPIPNGSAPEGAFDSVDKVVGRIAVVDIGLREPITNLKLAAEGAAGGLSAVIPAGYRAMTVKVDDVVGVSGFVTPGSFVDVVVVITPRGEGQQVPISKIVLQNIKVLANDQNIDRPKDERGASSVKAVTLQVTPEEAEKLALATTEGRLQLVMRNYGDQDAAKTRGVNTQALLSGDSSPVAQPTPQKAEPAKSPAPRPRRRIVIPREEPRPVPVAQATPAPPPPRRIQAIEGAKKRDIEIP